MIIQSENRTFESSEGLTQKGFTINASGKAFEILSSGLYKDKVLAIIREISCNAYDAMVAVGRPQESISVHLPTSLEPWYSVLDNGPGLSHDDVINLYSTYFASTKASSNDYIGAFGLGSKSPFSYVDAFTITSRHNGKKRIYSAFKNADGMPSITLMHEEDTNECNGFEVQVPVKHNDNSEFYQKSQDFYRFFEPKPNFNCVIAWDDKFSELAGMKLINDNSVTVYLLQGNVSYPVDKIQFNDLIGNEREGYNYNKVSFVIPVPIGTIEVTASREGISYTPNTIQAIRTLLIDKKTEALNEINAKFDACTSYYEAYKFSKIVKEQYLNNILFDVNKNLFTYITYKGKELKWPEIYGNNKDARLINTRYISNINAVSFRKNISIQRYYMFEECSIEKTTYYVNDISASKLVSTLVFNKDKFSTGNIYILEGTDPEAYIREKLADFLPHIKLNFVKLSSFPQITPVAKPKIKPFIVKAVKFTEYLKGDNTTIDFDISKGCKYIIGRYKYTILRPVNTDFSLAHTYYSRYNNIQGIIEANKDAKVLDFDNVYIIPIRFQKKLLRYANVCEDFEEEVKKKIDALKDEQDLKDYNDKVNKAKQLHFDGMFKELIDKKALIEPTSTNALATIAFYENIQPTEDRVKEAKISIVNAFRKETFDRTQKNYYNTNHYLDTKIRNDFFNTYPLLKNNTSLLHYGADTHTIEYINMCKR